MNITVYLGANEGTDASLKDAVKELGQWISKSGSNLVYGGSKPGLMGVLADTVLANGGTVTGVQTELFLEDECYQGLTKLITTKDLAERKAKMRELGDAFIALPGGTGTLDEIADVIAQASLGQMDKPIIIYNFHGYYNGLEIQLNQMLLSGLSSEERQSQIHFVRSLDEITKILA